jgi:hypothetical protein
LRAVNPQASRYGVFVAYSSVIALLFPVPPGILYDWEPSTAIVVVATIFLLSREVLALSNIAQMRKDRASTKRGTPTPAPIAASWHALQVAVEVAYPEFDVSFPSDDDATFSAETFASRARPAMTLPLATGKGTPSLSEWAGQVILEPSEIGDPQQYVEIPFLK